MTDWIDFGVYAAFHAMLWFGLPAANARFLMPILADRNPDWLQANPAEAERLARSRWFRVTSAMIGALGLAALLGVQLGVWPEALSAPVFEPHTWMVLSDVNVAVVLVWVVFNMACGALFTGWLERNVPLAERRHATLARRSIDDYVPRGVRRTIYTIVVLHLGLWLIVGVLMGVLGLETSREFWGMFAFAVAIALIFFLIVRSIALRRPNVMDRVFGPEYRRTEVRVAFGAQLLPLMNGLARLYEQASGTVLVDVDRASRLGLVAAMIAALVFFFVRYSRPSNGRGPDAGMMRTTRSAHVSVILFMLVTQLMVEVVSGK